MKNNYINKEFGLYKALNQIEKLSSDAKIFINKAKKSEAICKRRGMVIV